tara:strand:+ start:3182 stop:3544 length:363 start_codon:yes stop_codon:yes gene_type:complete
MKRIVLVFDETNDFDPTKLKYNDPSDDRSIILNASWFINCAMGAIEKSEFPKDSERYLEMRKLYENMKGQLKDQVTEDNEIKSIPLRECYTIEELFEMAKDNPNDMTFGALIRSKVLDNG